MSQIEISQLRSRVNGSNPGDLGWRIERVNRVSSLLCASLLAERCTACAKSREPKQRGWFDFIVRSQWVEHAAGDVTEATGMPRPVTPRLGAPSGSEPRPSRIAGIAGRLARRVICCNPPDP